MTHDAKVQAASTAIREVHSDTSVSLETTLESLERLKGEIEGLIEAVEADLS